MRSHEPPSLWRAWPASGGLSPKGIERSRGDEGPPFWIDLTRSVTPLLWLKQLCLVKTETETMKAMDDDEALVIVPIAQVLQLIRRHRHEKMLRSIIGGWSYVTVCLRAQPLARERGYAKQTPCPPSCAEACSFCKDGRCDLPADHEKTMCIEWHSCGCFIPARWWCRRQDAGTL